MTDNFTLFYINKYTENKDEYEFRYKKFMEKYPKIYDDYYHWFEYSDEFGIEKITCACGITFKFDNRLKHLKCKRHNALLNVLNIDKKKDII